MKPMRKLYLEGLKPRALIAELEVLEWRFERVAVHAESLQREARYTRSLAVKWWREWIKASNEANGGPSVQEEPEIK